jgi:hypothetical protein
MVWVTPISTGQSAESSWPRVDHQNLFGLDGILHVCSLKEAAEKSVSDEVFAKRSERWPEDEGCSTKEAYFYRDIFECESGGVIIVRSSGV